MSFWRRRGSLAASVSRHVVEAERRAKPLEAPIAPGTRVTVGPATTAGEAYYLPKSDRYEPARAEELDGLEGDGWTVVAVDWDVARLRHDDGHEVVGVQRSRLRRV